MNKRTYTDQQYQSGVFQHNTVIIHTALSYFFRFNFVIILALLLVFDGSVFKPYNAEIFLKFFQLEIINVLVSPFRFIRIHILSTAIIYFLFFQCGD